jgi:hypothetical protein
MTLKNSKIQVDQQEARKKTTQTHICQSALGEKLHLIYKMYYLNSFNITFFQFEAYEIEKKAENFEEAAKCFTYMFVFLSRCKRSFFLLVG